MLPNRRRIKNSKSNQQQQQQGDAVVVAAAAAAAEDNDNDNDIDNISSCSLSEASLRLDQAAEQDLNKQRRSTRRSTRPSASGAGGAGGAGGGSSSGEESFDLEIGVVGVGVGGGEGGGNGSSTEGSVDIGALTDDDDDYEDDDDDEDYEDEAEGETSQDDDEMFLNDHRDHDDKDTARADLLLQKNSSELSLLQQHQHQHQQPNGAAEEQQDEEVAPLELQRVYLWRRAVMVAFVLGMTATGVLTYLYLTETLVMTPPSSSNTTTLESVLPVVAVLVSIWIVVAGMVWRYDRAVRIALTQLQATALKNTAIVNSLFPENVRSRMLKEEEGKRRRIQKQQKQQQQQKQKQKRQQQRLSGSMSISTDGKNSHNNNNNNSFKSGMISLGGYSLGSSKEGRKQRLRERRRQRRGGRRRSDGSTGTSGAGAGAGGSPANETQVTAADTEMTDETANHHTHRSSRSSRSRSRSNSRDMDEGHHVDDDDHDDDGDHDHDDDDDDDDDEDAGLIPKDILTNKPIADFFPHCTVLFADIVGFTAWSSVRDPTAVFTLLESLYSCFDGIARRLKVFKVETIGDCYVAVTGLPEAQQDHAVRMAQFSRACMGKMIQIVRALEKHLGPDTGDLSMRFGLHSGPVTAGVMRGEKSRFQLFGDTVNTAARIESTGMRAKVHLSESMAEHLKEAGKDHWVQARDTMVQAKGKGQLQTYWLVMTPSTGSTTAAAADKKGNGGVLKSGNDSSFALDMNDNSLSSINDARSFGGGVNGIVAMFEKTEKLNKIGERTRRQADYTVEVLSQILKKIVAQRWGTNAALAPVHPTPVELQQFSTMEATQLKKSKLPLDEVSDAIDFSQFLKTPAPINVSRVQIPRNVLDQLEDFVTTVASMYQGHPFHCWEHASHVTISLTKLHSRLVDPSKKGGKAQSMTAHKQWQRKMPKGGSGKGDPSALGDDTAFGIPNDPMTEFALVFAAMIHDIDHSGFPNAKLVKENADVSKKYGKKSPAEQNSIDMAWAVFQRPAYQQLRRFIYSTEAEMLRFRQLVVTLVMATDIIDRDLLKERNKRWERAFTKKGKKDAETINQRATLTLEAMIQVSNIAHCTQHWNVYIKWNKKLFQEMCDVYKTGRQSGQKDPADFWYQGELAFFDDIVIPLAHKLTECGAFGDDAEEFLTYAKSNRRDWQSKGRDIIMDYVSETRGGNGMRSSTHSNGMRASTHSTSSAISSMWSSDGSLTFKPTSSHTPKWSKPSMGSASNFQSSLSNFQSSLSSISSPGPRVPPYSAQAKKTPSS